MLTELYETQFQIHNHLRKNSRSPFSSVAFHPSEDTVNGSRKQEAIRNHIELRIHEIVGLDYDHYVNRPPDDVLLINEEVRRYIEAKSKKADELARKLKEGMSETPEPKL